MVIPLGLGPQIPWAEMSVVGMGKDAEVQPGAHSRLSSVDRISIEQNFI